MAKILFLHLPKTAGTSLRHALQEAYGAEAVSPHVNACFLQNSNLELLNRFTFICGHLSFSDVHRLFPDAAIMTVVRNRSNAVSPGIGMRAQHRSIALTMLNSLMYKQQNDLILKHFSHCPQAWYFTTSTTA